ncbi:MAG: hypothetical protein JJE52_15005 [Acidimicrobiia bacterium]|nr:hypothetical protein [Acidimicrobiia bacterium]
MAEPATFTGALMSRHELDQMQQVAVDLRDALSRLPAHTHVLFTAPAADEAARANRDTLAQLIANSAGLRPWPDWATVRHGDGTGPHLLNVLFDLGETGRADAAVVCPLSPIDGSLLAHAATVASAAGLELSIVGTEAVT